MSERFVGRGGHKLNAALEHWVPNLIGSLDGVVAADLGANVGGFTDCLLKAGAARVYSVDTSYGVFEWTLRNDERVVVMERTNALHLELPENVYIAAVDVGWTRQHHIIPAAWKHISPNGWIISLLKPHYEASKSQRRGGEIRRETVDEVVQTTCETLKEMGFPLADITDSPLLGGKAKNPEFLLLIGPKID